ncbi:hypothetical protein FHX59_006068 [Paraburkholderia silvatlantica]|uniref:Uncharacterized protein n=1 Tax=Paraburkholderia silvatlantica TaxID=321895 RepID=A0ABR6FVX6_9BURK|nr:hypothetical protein [Paraburkholderia silvatlantica]PVY26612.1 hypothetical protein C7411_12375 [Paraburkholderia silvatlantica]PXW32877.1 hypothetical protein C7413_12275 [Paraburkholderia silvatlantica]
MAGTEQTDNVAHAPKMQAVDVVPLKAHSSPLSII